MKWSEVLSNRVSNINKRYTDRMKCVTYMAFSFITFFHILLVLFFFHCMYGCVFCMLLFNFVAYVFFIIMLKYSYCYFVYSYCYVNIFLLLCCALSLLSLCILILMLCILIVMLMYSYL